MTKLEKTIQDAIEPIINKLSYQLYDVIYEKEAGENYLRIFIENIDNNKAISINDCEIVNNAITDLLDEKDFIKNAYILEVSSPGLERRIRNNEQLKKCIGQKVNVKLYKKNEKISNKDIIGILDSFDENNVFIKLEKQDNQKKDSKKKENSKKSNIMNYEIIAIEKSNIAKMNTVFDF